MNIKQMSFILNSTFLLPICVYNTYNINTYQINYYLKLNLKKKKNCIRVLCTTMTQPNKI